MPISTNWYDDEQRVILQKFEGNWSWEELNREQAVMGTFANSVSHSLVLLTDMSHTHIIPKGNVLGQGKSSVANVPDNITQIIIVIQSRLIEVFAGLVFEMIPKWRNRVLFVKTVEEGQKRVAEAVAKNTANSSAG
jgi:hypothetical protein